MFLRKYGTGTGADVIIPIIKRGVVDFAVSADWTPASGDVKVSKDGGTEANIGTLPVINGTTGWKFVFSDAELQCKSLTVRIVDSATKAVEDQFFIVETYGNASAMFQSDLAAAQLPANVTHFGGTAGTFAAGRPEVNTTHVGGTSQTAGDLATMLTAIDDFVDTEVAAIKAKTDNLPADPADASDIASAFSTVNSTLATIAAYIDTEVAAIKAKTDNLPTDPADASDIAASFSSLATTLSTIAGYIDTEVAAIKAKTDNLPTDPADQSAVEAAITAAVASLATQTSVNTLTAYVDTEVAAIKAVTDKIDTMVEVDGLVYRYTTNALEQAPAGGGGGSGDWTTNEKAAIRTILGIPGSGTTPADPTDGVLYDIKQKTDQIGSAGAITSLLAGAVLDPGTITSFPSELVIGDSYQETNGREIQIPLVDTDGNVLTTVGDRLLGDATATFTLQRINEADATRVITGTATIVDPPGTGTGSGAPYAVVELPADETEKGLVGYKYKGHLILTWSGPGTDVYSFHTETVKFTY